ncbi:hypothetical protein [Raoultibacter phocaeensis]|uniref:hypothetical protein n=1 Tax=Raoultibacter phocaeensis TaxID=2479841 RepID=UPI001117CCA4|nr:hypothetical protein [Raoultibacter phocaeensis]
MDQSSQVYALITGTVTPAALGLVVLAAVAALVISIIRHLKSDVFDEDNANLAANVVRIALVVGFIGLLPRLAIEIERTVESDPGNAYLSQLMEAAAKNDPDASWHDDPGYGGGFGGGGGAR